VTWRYTYPSRVVAFPTRTKQGPLVGGTLSARTRPVPAIISEFRRAPVPFPPWFPSTAPPSRPSLNLVLVPRQSHHCESKSALLCSAPPSAPSPFPTSSSVRSWTDASAGARALPSATTTINDSSVPGRSRGSGTQGSSPAPSGRRRAYCCPGPSPHPLRRRLSAPRRSRAACRGSWGLAAGDRGDTPCGEG
jgi:hypothetical protein